MNEKKQMQGKPLPEWIAIAREILAEGEENNNLNLN